MQRYRLLGRARCFGAYGGGEGRGYIAAAARQQLVSTDTYEPTTVLFLTDNTTYFQFHFPLVVCFYTMVKLKLHDYRFEKKS